MGTFPTVAAVLLLGVGTSALAQVVFDAADVSGAFQDPNGADLSLPTDSNAALTLTRPDLPKKGNLVRLCECSSDQPEISSIRDLSNKWLAGGTAPTSYGFTNLVWSWGQFIGAQRVLCFRHEHSRDTKLAYVDCMAVELRCGFLYTEQYVAGHATTACCPELSANRAVHCRFNRSCNFEPS